MRLSTVVMLVLLVGPPGITTVEAHAAKPLVAVIPFGSPENQNFSNLGRNAQPAYIAHFINSGKVAVVNERALRRAVSGLGVKKSGLLHPNKAKQLGQLLKADYILTGALTFFGNTYTMTTHLINARTAENEQTEVVDFRNARKFRVIIHSSAQKMISLMVSAGSKIKKHGAFKSFRRLGGDLETYSLQESEMEKLCFHGQGWSRSKDILDRAGGEVADSKRILMESAVLPLKPKEAVRI